MTEPRFRGQDPPAKRMTVESSSESEDEAEEKFIAPKIERTGSEDAPASEPAVVQSDPEVTPEEEESSDVDDEGSSVDSKVPTESLNTLQTKPPAPNVEEDKEEDEEDSEEEEEDSDYDSEEEDEYATTKKPKRLSYSRDILKSTKEGSRIQSGEEIRASSQSKAHVPGYVNKQLKATGYGDKLKKGGAVPRDIVPQPEDPNARLGDMYKSVKLKQGKEKARENPSNLNSKAGNEKKAPAYASVTLKKAEKPEGKLLKGETSPTTLPAVKLNKAAPIVKEEKRSSFPDVKLNKTVPVAKDPTSHFELPSEFSQAKQKLKRRTERHWYENELPEAKPSKKWFFQSGEWNDGSTPKPTTSKKSGGSWFFGGSSRDSKKPPQLTSTAETEEAGASLYRGHFTRVTTGKDLARVQHFNELSVGEAKSKKSPTKGKFSKQYHEDLQRQRKGLPPIRRRRSLLWRILVWCCLVPLAVYCGTMMFPEQVNAAWKHVLPQIERILNQLEPHVAYAMEQVEPHVSALVEQVQPRVFAVAEQVQPHFIAALDRVCTSVDAYEVPEDKKWLQSIHGASAALCDSMRVNFVAVAEAESEEDPDRHERVATASMDPSSKGKQRSKQAAGTSNNAGTDECECDPNSKGPKWVKRLIPGGHKDKSAECCNKKKQTEKEEKEL